MKNTTIYEYLADNYDITPDETTKLILAIQDFNDSKQDARIDELGRVIDKIHRWVSIIGFVYLMIIITTIIMLLLNGFLLVNLYELFK